MQRRRQSRTGSLASAAGRKRETRARNAFSLIELLMVLVILLILTTMYWSFTSKGQHQNGCRSNLQRLYVALQIYANEHAGAFPAVAGARSSEAPLDLLVPHYTVDASLFICPASKDSSLAAGESLRGRRVSYAYYQGRRLTDSQEVLLSDWQVDTNSKAAGQPLFSLNGKPPGNNHGDAGGNLLFGDGRVETCGVRAPCSLVLTQGVGLLNPRR